MQRDLVIRWKPSVLTKDVSLLLTFSLLDPHERFPAWREVKMTAYKGNNISYTNITYTGSYAFGTTIEHGGNRGSTSTFMPIKVRVGVASHLDTLKYGGIIVIERGSDDTDSKRLRQPSVYSTYPNKGLAVLRSREQVRLHPVNELRFTVQ
jgi:hypothetical protein